MCMREKKLNWRRENKIDILKEPDEFFFKEFPYKYLGEAENGSPVYFAQAGLWVNFDITYIKSIF